MLRWSAGVRGDSGQGRAIFLRFGFTIILAKECKCTKNAKLTLLSTISHYNRSKSDASSSLPDAYSMLWYLWYHGPMKRRRAWRRQWSGKSDIASFWLYYNASQGMQMHQKCKIDLLSSINHYNRSKSHASLIAARCLFNALVPLVPMLRWSAGVRGGDSGQGRAILLRFGCIIVLAKECKYTKNAKFTLLSSIDHYNRSKSDTSSSLPDAYSMLWYLWHQCSDEATACVEETVAREERFCFVLVVL